MLNITEAKLRTAAANNTLQQLFTENNIAAKIVIEYDGFFPEVGTETSYHAVASYMVLENGEKEMDVNFFSEPDHLTGEEFNERLLALVDKVFSDYRDYEAR